MVPRITPKEIIATEYRMTNISDKIAYCADEYIVFCQTEINFKSKITISEH